MNYEEALRLKSGDKVIVVETGEEKRVEFVSGTLKDLFILLDDGHDYHQSQLKRK